MELLVTDQSDKVLSLYLLANHAIVRVYAGEVVECRERLL
jgi:hypothetical protein